MCRPTDAGTRIIAGSYIAASEPLSCLAIEILLSWNVLDTRAPELNAIISRPAPLNTAWFRPVYRMWRRVRINCQPVYHMVRYHRMQTKSDKRRNSKTENVRNWNIIDYKQCSSIKCNLQLQAYSAFCRTLKTHHSGFRFFMPDLYLCFPIRYPSYKTDIGKHKYKSGIKSESLDVTVFV